MTRIFIREITELGEIAAAQIFAGALD